MSRTGSGFSREVTLRKRVQAGLNASSESPDSSFTFEGLPFGSYVVEVKTPLMSAGKRRIEVEVGQAEQSLTVCLSWNGSALTMRSSPAPIRQLNGRIRSGLQDAGRYWIRAVSVYGDSGGETISDSDGKFSINGLEFGYYVVIITRPNAEPRIRQVRFESSSVLEFDAP